MRGILLWCLSVRREGRRGKNHTADWRTSSEPGLESGQYGDDDRAEDTQSTQRN
jgi:hypothetical protein